METAGKLPLKTKLGFGVYDLGGNLFFTVMGFYSLNFLTDVVRIDPAVAGLIVLIGKIWDAVTDPVMGFISDRTQSRWGRRRPWIFIGSVPLFLSMWWFFTKPGIADPTGLAIWAGVALAALNTAYTIVNIPYSSLTPDLTKDYNERTSLNGYRFGFAVIGTLIGAGAVGPIVGLAPTQEAGFSTVGLLFGLLMLITALITVFSVKEKDNRGQERPKGKFLPTYLAVFKCKPYLILAFTYALHLAGITFLSGIIVYYFKYIYQNEFMGTIAMLVLLVIAMCFIPVSVLISKKRGKKFAYQVFFALESLVCLLIFFLGHELGMYFFLAMMVPGGVALGFSYVAPYAMLPDAVEVDAIQTGVKKEGSFYGMWTFLSKVGQSVAFYGAGAILSAFHFVPNVVQHEGSIFAMRLLIGPVPVLCFAAAFFLLLRYPIDEQRYKEIMEGRS